MSDSDSEYKDPPRPMVNMLLHIGQILDKGTLFWFTYAMQTQAQFDRVSQLRIGIKELLVEEEGSSVTITIFAGPPFILNENRSIEKRSIRRVAEFFISRVDRKCRNVPYLFKLDGIEFQGLEHDGDTLLLFVKDVSVATVALLDQLFHMFCGFPIQHLHYGLNRWEYQKVLKKILNSKNSRQIKKLTTTKFYCSEDMSLLRELGKLEVVEISKFSENIESIIKHIPDTVTELIVLAPIIGAELPTLPNHLANIVLTSVETISPNDICKLIDQWFQKEREQLQSLRVIYNSQVDSDNESDSMLELGEGHRMVYRRTDGKRAKLNVNSNVVNFQVL